MKPLAAVVKEQLPLTDQPTPQPTPTIPEVGSKPPMPEISFSSIVQQSVQTPGAVKEDFPPQRPFAGTPSMMTPSSASLVNNLPESDKDRQALRNKYPSSFADLIASFHYAKTKTYGRGDEVLRNQHLLHILDYSLQQCPDIIDSERPPRFVSSKPVSTPPYYPQTAMIPFDSPALYEQLDIDTLFFIFYYMPGTKQQ
jgi:CCR4-NOT transcription complex subunit 3